MDNTRWWIDRYGLAGVKSIISGIQGQSFRILITPLDNIILGSEANPNDVVIEYHILQIVFGYNCKLHVGILDIYRVQFVHYFLYVAIVTEQVIDTHKVDLSLDCKINNL